MKEIYPEFADSVDFYAIGQDPTEGIQELEDFRVKEGHPWPVATVSGEVLRNLRIVSQSTKVAVDHRGAITYRAGFGDGDGDKWQEVLADLASASS
jgi:hypothetical protein